jgi:hypothetical protein
MTYFLKGTTSRRCQEFIDKMFMAEAHVGLDTCEQAVRLTLSHLTEQQISEAARQQFRIWYLRNSDFSDEDIHDMLSR